MLEKLLIEGMYIRPTIEYEWKIGKNKENFIRYKINSNNTFINAHYYIDVYMNGKVKVVYATTSYVEIKNFYLPLGAFYDLEGNSYDELHLFDMVIRMTYCKCVIPKAHGIYHFNDNNNKKGVFSNFYIQ